jgi:hypothetical protein
MVSQVKSRGHHRGKQVGCETHQQGVLGGPKPVWAPEEEESEIGVGPESSDENDSDTSSHRHQVLRNQKQSEPRTARKEN